MKKAGIFVVLFLFSATVGMAQKYGHLNFGNLLAAMPETQAADKELDAYQKQLVAKGEKMAKDFQNEVQAYFQAAQNMAPVKAQEREQELQQKQQEILNYEQEVAQKVNQKRQQLLKPIIEKANNVIAQVAKEQGYVMVFDTSVFNAVLFAKDSEDIMVFVAAKLGLD